MDHGGSPTTAQRFLGMTAVLAAAYWVITVISFHFIRTDLDPCCTFVSNYGRGQLEWWMQSAFVILGLAWIGVAIALHRNLRGTRGIHLVAIWASLLGVGLVGSGIFRSDDIDAAELSTEGALHDLSGMLMLVAIIGLIPTTFRTFRRADAWRPIAWPSLSLGSAFAAVWIGLIVFFTALEDSFGWWQRIAVIAVLPAWLALLGYRLTRVAQS